MDVKPHDFRWVLKGPAPEVVGVEKVHLMLSRDYPDAWIYPVSGARSPTDHHELMCLLDELERALGSPFEGAPELRVHAVLCGHRINAMPALAALEEASSSVLVAQRLNEEGERACVVNGIWLGGCTSAMVHRIEALCHC